MQLLSLALLRLSLLCLEQAELKGCDLRAMWCSTEAELRLLSLFSM